MRNLPHMKKPCSNCPFRKDTLKGWLGEAKMKEILSADSFVCHKRNEMQCAGHMIIKGEANCFVSTAESMRIELDLSGQELIFKTEEDCLNHHKQI